MKEKAPGTLTEWTRLFIEHGWVTHEELVNISTELLYHMGPVNLDLIIMAAQELKADYEAEETPEGDWNWESSEDTPREIIEGCPHCENESKRTLTTADIKRDGGLVSCSHCGHVILLCSECTGAHCSLQPYCFEFKEV